MMPALTADDCQKLMGTAVTKAKELSVSVTIAIVDDGGYLLSLIRLDGTSRISAEVAMGKARTAALMRRPSSAIEKMVEDHPPYVGIPHILAMTGGLPFMRDGICVGAIGVTGAPAENDVTVAQAAVDVFASLT
jgi:glc operon protein GlcG